MHRPARRDPRRARAPRPALVEQSQFKAGLHDLGFDTGASETPITPVITGEEERTQTFARRLFDEGVFCPAIVFPAVAHGQARVRMIVTADHTEDDLREALEVFGRVGRELGLV